MFHKYALVLGAMAALALVLAWLASLLFPDFGFLALALGGIVAIALLSQIMRRYYFHASTEYVVADSEITEVKGFWAKDERHVPISKIQNYTIDRSMIGKLLGIANVGVQTARAESGYEITLRAISEKEVEALDKLLGARAESGKK